MKTLVMPVRSLPSTIPTGRIKRHLWALRKALRYVAAITLALVVGIAATLVVASLLAVCLALILGIAAALVAALIFMVVSPEGNLLLLLLLSQLWLLYAPRETAPKPQPDGGLTMKPEARAAWLASQSLAA